MIARLFLITAVFAASACDGGGGNASTAPKHMTIANPFQDKLMALSDLNRSLALRRAIQDSGAACKKIVASTYQGQYKSLHMWAGRCAPGGDHAIFIAPNGDVQVRGCADTATLGLPACKLDGAASG